MKQQISKENPAESYPAANFHPVIAQWFQQRFRAPTEPQRLGWPAIQANQNVLIAAPTGSGKTLSAFMVCIDRLFRDAIAVSLQETTAVLYISPLKALSNDIKRNLEIPLAEINTQAKEAGLQISGIRVKVRTGDTPARERVGMLKQPPHILVTTPESFYLLLTSEKSRAMLSSIQTVIVDEIHALARDKRGSHLALSLERLDDLCETKPVRIGLSATQRPLNEIAQFLVGAKQINDKGDTNCHIIDVGHLRALDLQIEVPKSELSAVCSNETWDEIYHRLTELVQSHRSTLIFVNTRRLAERVCYTLTGLLGDDAVASHHGSLSRKIRLSAEERLKSGQLKAIVATASLELGIDIGFIDLVIQIGSTRSIATFLQRVGRSGHKLTAIPKGRLFVLTRDELIESMALVRSVRHGNLDRVEIPIAPKDILAQQIVAAVASEEWDEEELYEMCRSAWPYRNLTQNDFDDIIKMLSDGIGHSRRGAYLHRDAINKRLRARRGARLSAIISGGAIPDNAEYRVVTSTDRTFVGTVNEDFAIESMKGDIFVLGNTSWQIEHVRGQEVLVHDAGGAPASIPFWLGESPGRTIELSTELANLREELGQRVGEDDSELPSKDKNALHPLGPLQSGNLEGGNETIIWLQNECGVNESGARQALEYVTAQKTALGLIPTQKKIVFERFFDEAGGMQLVVHAPFGARINRAWGLAMRKRFCRSFDFELQASADDNGFVLSLGPQHSFPIDHLFKFLNRQNAEHNLTQALLAAPMFQVRWRWNITRALVVLRNQAGKRVPPALQRFRSDDLLTSVFPAQTACLENRPEDVEIPDHPLVVQTVYDCLHEAMDLDRWLKLIGEIQDDAIELIARDTREPSPFSYELLNANPYAFLDDAPLEERRARAVFTRRSLSIDEMSDLSCLDATAIAQVRNECWPLVRDADELHDALSIMKALPEHEGRLWHKWFDELIESGRATVVQNENEKRLWITTENWSLAQSIFPECEAMPSVHLPAALQQNIDASKGWIEIVRGRLSCVGPTTAVKLSNDLNLKLTHVQVALEALEAEGYAMRGRFSEQPFLESTGIQEEVEWCERRLLARIHRLTLDNLRKQIQPVEPTDFIKFLLDYQHITDQTKIAGQAGLAEVITQLQGFEMPAAVWEQSVLSARLEKYETTWLDSMSLAGEVSWGRLRPPNKSNDDPPSGSPLTRVVPISLVLRENLSWLLPFADRNSEKHIRSNARLVLETLNNSGALFFDDLKKVTRLLPAQLEEALSELAAAGLITADGFAAIRSIVSPNRHRIAQKQRRYNNRGKATLRPYSRGGRWSPFPGNTGAAEETDKRSQQWAWLLLDRYGVVFRDLLTRESVAPTWRELVPVYRQMEARGEIRGGRFVNGVVGEQFAHGESINLLREIRDKNPEDSWLVLSACDPVNLFGIITTDARIPAVRTNKIIVQDGGIIGALQSGKVTFYGNVAEPLKERIRDILN